MTCNVRTPNRIGWGFCLFSFIFSACSHTAPDVPFLLVAVKNMPYLFVERRVVRAQSLGNIFVYGGLGYMVMGCGRADGCSRFDDVHSQFAGSFLQRFFQ